MSGGHLQSIAVEKHRVFLSLQDAFKAHMSLYQTEPDRCVLENKEAYQIAYSCVVELTAKE